MLSEDLAAKGLKTTDEVFRGDVVKGLRLPKCGDRIVGDILLNLLGLL